MDQRDQARSVPAGSPRSPGPDPHGAPKVLLAGVGEAIDDEILRTFAVVAEPSAVPGELLRRYGDLFTRMSLYTPYAMDPEATATIRTILNAPAP
ncbi:MAG TPA: hypothetical protein VMC03_11355 [Streptosporangiaceae bacterium]|nr:hypothetical protein [Streptosporangiaceae bacterium]